MTAAIPFTICPDRRALGEAAGNAIAVAMRERIFAGGSVAVVFGSAPSQDETLAALVAAPGIAWRRVTAFHLDEYVGAVADAPFSFRRYLADHLFAEVPPGIFHGIRGEAPDAAAECARYGGLLRQTPPDIVLLGIGENGHIAFNDPPCDFGDPLPVKIVKLTESCRRQQVHDGIFCALDQVPCSAITLTVSAILNIPRVFVMVPGSAKAPAVAAAVVGPLSPHCPASILRMHPSVRLYLDPDSASRLPYTTGAAETA